MGESQGAVELQRVLYVSEISADLISVSLLCGTGFDIQFSRNEYTIRNKGKLVGKGQRVGNIYKISAQKATEECVNVSNAERIVEEDRILNTESDVEKDQSFPISTCDLEIWHEADYSKNAETKFSDWTIKFNEKERRIM